MKRLVTGILAHVDSGKTTLSEIMLYRSGEIRKLGRVDHGNAFLDTHELEKSRGITIFSKQAVLHFGDCEITLLDTPGHVDFSLEAERTLQVLDYAILVVSGSEGVQSHTETLWKLLESYNVPVFIFVNKMDLDGADKEKIMLSLKHTLNSGCVDFNSDHSSEAFLEEIAACDEAAMDEYFDNGNISKECIVNAICGRRIFPVCFGSALKEDGIDDFLNVISEYTKQPVYNDKFAAKVFKITEDDQGNRLTHLKVTGGSIKVKELLSGNASSWSEKVNQLRIYSGSKFQAADEVYAGMVCAVTGLTKTFSGEGLGAEPNSNSLMLEPVLNYCVGIPDDADAHTVMEKLKKLEEEDPQLHLSWNEQLQEIHISVMGEIQLEILKSVVQKRFGLNIYFKNGGIAYKETIKNKVEGVGHYEPLRHYAEVHLILEPAPVGSGLHFSSKCPEDSLSRNWQRLILTHLEEKTHLGVLTGSPVTDMKITLAAGKAHLKHTEGGDFRQATYRAVRQGLMNAESVLLEPWYDFRLEIPNEAVGRAMSDLQVMCGNFEAPYTDGETSVITGSAPVSEMRDYHNDVISYTKGRGRLSCMVKGYFPCHNQEKVVAEIAYDSEADLANSPDSVFCTHGAGFVVKWNDVPEYMHLESVLKPKKEEYFTPITRSQLSSYRERLEDDKELMAIFERTYGPIKRDTRSAMHTEKHIPQPKVKTKPLPKGPEYLLVDGYNIIFAWDELKEAAKENLDFARSLLINMLCNYQGFRQCNLILVFDAYKVKGNHGEVEKHHNITVIYTKEAETADMFIEKATHELSKEHRVRVATSDNLEQLIILGNGAYRVSASEFYDEIKRTEQAIRDFIN